MVALCRRCLSGGEREHAQGLVRAGRNQELRVVAEAHASNGSGVLLEARHHRPSLHVDHMHVRASHREVCTRLVESNAVDLQVEWISSVISAGREGDGGGENVVPENRPRQSAST